MGVAADRVLRDAQRGAEHARLRRQRRCTSIDRKDEKAVGTQLVAESDQGVDIRRQQVQGAGVADGHQQARAALARDAGRQDFVQLSSGQAQRFGHAQSGFERQRGVQLGHGLTKLDERCVVRAVDRAHLEDAGPRMLPAHAHAAASEGQQYRMSGNGGVSDERRLLAGVEEAQAHIVVRAGGREHERDFGMGKLARHGAQRRVVVPVGIEHDRGRIAGEARPGKGIHLKNAHRLSPQLLPQFCTAPCVRLHLNEPWGGL